MYRQGEPTVSSATLTPDVAAAPTGNLEITVSRAELLRELTAAQSVVERKTTIPILSNFLFEAEAAAPGETTSSPSPRQTSTSR